MAIAGYKPNTDLPTKPNLPKTQPKDYKSIIYDNNNIPLTSLIAYVEGSPWTGDYYSQVHSEHNDLREIDAAQPSVYQQYQKIINFEIRVDNPLNTGYDAETAVTTSSGSGLVYPFIIPNVSDYFVTDVGSNRRGIFKVINVERKTFNRDSVFSIDYDLVGYVEVLTEIYQDLENKVIRTYHFNKDRLIEGLNPMLVDNDYNTINDLNFIYKDIISYYFSTFFNIRYSTLLVPGQPYAIYDHFLVSYLLKILTSFEAPEIRLIRQIPIDNEEYLKQSQFWTLLLSKDYDSLPIVNQKMSIVNKLMFNNSPFMHGINYSNIDYIVYPYLPDLTPYVKNLPIVKQNSNIDLIQIANSVNQFPDLVNSIYTEDINNYAYIKEVTVDDYYVLSSDLYNNTTNLSLLEILVKDYLKNKSIDLDKLYALCSKYKTWGRLEQFYYCPILITLIKDVNRGTYT